MPTASAVVVTEAVPEVRVGVPSDVAPSRKLTVPVGVPVPPEVTAAVKVRLPPLMMELADEVSVVVVAMRVGGGGVVAAVP